MSESVSAWIERELRVRHNLGELSPEQEKEIRFALFSEWNDANQSRLLDDARKKDAIGLPSVVYFAQKKKTGEIKIGTSTRVEKRLRSLGDLVLLAKTPGSYKVEAWMHYRFERARIRGEWFRPTPELLEYIEGLKE